MLRKLCFLLLTQPIIAATVLREADVGDFSDDYLNPTVMNLMPGVNTIQFTTGGGPVAGGGATNGSDGDFVTFALEVGQVVTGMRVSEQDRILTPNGGPSAHFFGAEFGSTFSNPPSGSTSSPFANALDFTRLYDDFINNNLLFQGAGQPDVQPDRTFAAIFQETSVTAYEVTIEITVIPEPSVSFLLLIALLPLARRR